KRRNKKLPLIVANDASSAIGSDDNTLILIDDDGVHPLPTATKTVQARRVMAHIARLYAQYHPASTHPSTQTTKT
ncbi:MAG: phosphopantothenate synthase, partial [Nitrosomonas sp.]|nr:phosphopantothenate synthase [Nitrosomonas sp.]